VSGVGCRVSGVGCRVSGVGGAEWNLLIVKDLFFLKPEH